MSAFSDVLDEIAQDHDRRLQAMSREELLAEVRRLRANRDAVARLADSYATRVRQTKRQAAAWALAAAAVSLAWMVLP